MSRDRSRSSDWNNARRPRVSNRLSLPNRRDGSDGDLQIRQTNLGAKLFGKIGGKWHSTFLSSEEEVIGTSGTKIGMSSSGALSVDQILLTGKISLTSAGTQNVCIGTNNSDIGTQNIAIGVDAGSSFSVETAQQNICVGFQAGKAITTGVANTLIGYIAGNSITTGGFNAYVGHAAGQHGTSTYNTGIGYGALPAVALGHTNTTLGYLSGLNIVDGDYNIMIGPQVGLNGSDVTSSICIGVQASATADSAIALGGGVTNTVASSCKIACTGGLYLDGNIIMTDDTSIGISDSDERIEFDGAGDISLLGCKVGINTTTIPHAAEGYAMLALDGAAGDAAGPHIQVTTATNDYPIFQMLNWSHDNIALNFDSYYDGAWKSSDAGSNFQIYKHTDALHINADNGIAAGVALTWDTLMTITTAGNVGIGTDSPNQKLTVEGTISLKEVADDGTSVAGYSQIWVKNTGDGILMFSDDDGTEYTVDVTAV